MLFCGCSSDIELYKQNTELQRQINALQDSLKTYSAVLKELSIPEKSSNNASFTKLQNSYLGFEERIENLEDMVTFHGDRIESMYDIVTDNAIRIEELNSNVTKKKVKKTHNSHTPKIDKSSVQKTTKKKIEEINEQQLPADTHYSQARVFYVNHNYSAAIDKFNYIIDHFSKHTLIPNCYYWIAEIKYDLKNYQEAIEDFKYICKFYPDTQKAIDAMYKIVVTYQRLGEKELALDTALNLKKKYPQYVRMDNVDRVIEELNN
jgi:TolA-binding protein